MKDKVKEELLKLDLSTLSFQILCHLTFSEKIIKPKDIAEELGLNSASVRARLSELRNKGLVVLDSTGYKSTIKPYDVLMKLREDLGKNRRGARS